MTTGSATSGYYTIDGGGNASIPGQTHYEYAVANGLTYFIPTEDEWYKAAHYDPSGPVYYDYPTGADTAPTATSGSTTAGEAVYNQGVSGAPADVDNSGGLSPYGTMGQGGNIYEWTESLMTAGQRSVRGGSYNYSTAQVSRLHASWRGETDPTYEGNIIGFRVSEVVPEPGSMTLLVCGLLGLAFVAWRKRRSR